MKRVLVTIHTPTFGGPHNQILRMYEPLRNLGWDTIVVLPEEAGNGYDRLTAAGIPCRRMPLHRLRASLNPQKHLALLSGLRREVRQLRLLMQEEQVDVVQICGLLSVHGALAAHAENLPVVWQLLSTFSPYPLRLLVTPLVTRLADVIMSTGESVAAQHPGALRIKERVIPFFPPVDTTQFRPAPEKREAARKALNVGAETFLIGTVGNFSRQKGHEFLVDAAAKIRMEFPNTAFRILGTETTSNAAYYNQAVRQRAAALDLTQNGYLTFINPGSAVADLLPAFDIFVLTSRAEGIPTAALEAMACGIPVVATNVGGVSEVVIDNVTGMLVNHLDGDSVAAAIRALLLDSELRQTMASATRKRAVAQYDLHRCTEVHAYAYEQAMQNHHKQVTANHVYSEVHPSL